MLINAHGQVLNKKKKEIKVQKHKAKALAEKTQKKALIQEFDKEKEFALVHTTMISTAIENRQIQYKYTDIDWQCIHMLPWILKCLSQTNDPQQYIGLTYTFDNE